MANYLMNEIPTELLCFLFTGACILLSFFLNSLFRKRVKNRHDYAIGEAGGIMFGAISLIYSLILAFAIVAAWEDYDEVNKHVIKEGVMLAEVRDHAMKLPAAISSVIEKDIVDYAKYELENEWYKLHHKYNKNGALHHLRIFLSNIDSVSVSDGKIIAAIEDGLTEISNERNERNSDVRSQIPLIVWLVLLAGSVLTLVLSWFFTLKHTWADKIFTGMLTGILSMCIFLLFMLDHPLCGTSAVSPRPLIHFIQESNR